jgi:hypothetical protein
MGSWPSIYYIPMKVGYEIHLKTVKFKYLHLSSEKEFVKKVRYNRKFTIFNDIRQTIDLFRVQHFTVWPLRL